MADAIAVCKTCGMPVRVVFDDDGEVAEVFAVCGHVKKPSKAEEATDAHR